MKRLCVEHFETQCEGKELALLVEDYLSRGAREFVSISYARTDPPNATKAALLIYRAPLGQR